MQSAFFSNYRRGPKCRKEGESHVQAIDAMQHGARKPQGCNAVDRDSRLLTPWSAQRLARSRAGPFRGLQPRFDQRQR